jgi:predicted CxxxxCH...CXXCH cytochrome family protein
MKLSTTCCFISTLLLIAWVTTAPAALQCNGCHGTLIPSDYRPLDNSYRDFLTGGFQGNHRTHLDTDSTAGTCAICHPGSSTFTSDHRDGNIKISNHINESPLITPYNNRTSAWPQTAIPSLESCQNVNCHFETRTPAWGSNSSPITCGTCHGAPPSGTDSPPGGGAAGSHAKHDQYYPGTNNCKKCHTNNTTFEHAFSAGKRELGISFAEAPNNGNGSYNGPLDDYLPSQNNVFGTCSDTYCHSPGNKASNFTAPNQTATWGGTLGCAGCHAAIPDTGSHTRHVGAFSVSCHKCHAATVTSATTISSTTFHLNRQVDIAFNSSTTASAGTYNGTPQPGDAFSTCSNVYCHSDGSSVASGIVPSTTSPTWGTSSTISCSGCHNFPPAYPNGTPKANSHTKHAGLGYGCNTCHAGTTADGTTISNPSLHANAQYNLSAGTGVSFRYTFAASGGTCSDISCHNNRTAVWGTTLTCGDCHVVSPGGD